tara:strand:- start:317 stop:622 length:306 start_codon:yes stop_codon:yes gene_type:complete
MKILTIFIWIILTALLIFGFIQEIRKSCHKAGSKECKSHKQKIIGWAIMITGIFTILPGFSWGPAIMIGIHHGKRDGKIALIITFIIGLILLITGAIVYST